MPSMKHLLFILTVTLASGLVKGQGNHPFIKSVNLFQQEDVVVLRWVMHGGNTCQGMKINRAENEVDFSQIGIISGICGSTDSDEQYTYVDSNATPNIINYYRIGFGTQGLSDSEGIFFEQFGGGDILVLPDPINDRTRVLFSNNQHYVAMLRVVNRNGTVFREITSKDEEIIVNMSGWKEGLYYFQLMVNDERKSGKLFKF
jgi:hypothetical protein